MNLRNLQSGLTLIELLVVIGIFGLLASIAMFFSIDFFRTYTFHSEQTALVSALSKARARSLANVNQNEHGVRIAGGQYVLFQGDGPSLTWATREASLDEAIPVGSGISPANRDIIFDQQRGNVTCDPDCTISLSGFGVTKQVSLNAQGAIIW